MAESSGKVPIIACVREAWGFLGANWRLFLPAAIIAAALGQVGRAFAMMSPPGEGRTMFSDMMGNLLVILPAAIASVVFMGAVLRKAIRDEYIGPTGLAAGADELRLLGVAAAFALILAPVFGLTSFVLAFVVLGQIAGTPEEVDALLQDPEALQAALGPAGAAAFAVFSILAIAIVLYIYARLFVVTAATIGERRMVMFQAWSWSRGNTGRVLAAIMLAWLPAYLVDSLAFELSLMVLQGVATPESAPLLALGLNIAVGFVAAMMSVPMIALAAILYKGLRPKDFVAR